MPRWLDDCKETRLRINESLMIKSKVSNNNYNSGWTLNFSVHLTSDLFSFFFFSSLQVSNFLDYNNLTLSKTSSWIYVVPTQTFPFQIPFASRAFSTPARSSHLKIEEPSKIFGKFLNSGSTVLNDDHVVVPGNLTGITATLYRSLQARNGKKVNETAPKSSGLPLYKFLMTHIFVYMFRYM